MLEGLVGDGVKVWRFLCREVVNDFSYFCWGGNLDSVGSRVIEVVGNVG